MNRYRQSTDTNYRITEYKKCIDTARLWNLKLGFQCFNIIFTYVLFQFSTISFLFYSSSPNVLLSFLNHLSYIHIQALLLLFNVLLYKVVLSVYFIFMLVILYFTFTHYQVNIYPAFHPPWRYQNSHPYFSVGLYMLLTTNTLFFSKLVDSMKYYLVRR